ncbi:MAG: HD domain-containing protein [Bacteroidetes bacterium]|nr:HD domain-containing protein [Bacteroidota bacterium]
MYISGTSISFKIQLVLTGLDPKHDKLFTLVSDAASHIGQPVYVVGGYVRDYYLNRLSLKEQPDIDFVTVGSGIALAEEVAHRLGTESLNIFKQFGTAHIKWHGIDLEFVGARKESYQRDSRKPIVEDGTVEDDQKRRDFTINALSWSLNTEDFGTLIDPFGGVQDMQNRLIRTPLDPHETFSDDPLRMLRAARFATQLGFSIHEETRQAMHRMAERLAIISQERIVDELNKIIMSPIPSSGFRILFETDLLNQFFPEMCDLHGVKVVNNIRHKDNFWHTLEVLDNVARVSDNLWLRWAAIMHDIAKPPTQRFVPGIGWTFHGHDALGGSWTKRIFARLGLPLDERMKYVRKLVRLHLRPIALVSEEVSDSAIRRLLFEAGDDIDDLMTLCRADITSKNDAKVKRYLKNFDHVVLRMQEVEEQDKLRNWQPPVKGDEIMSKLELKPGPDVGKIKKAIEEAILEGEIPNEYEAALAFMYRIKDDVLKT